jgi:hypothetical protein
MGNSFSQNVDAIITRFTSLVDTFMDYMSGGFANTVSKVLYQIALIFAQIRDALVAYIP